MYNITIHREIIHLTDIDIFCRDTRTDGPTILCLHGRWGRGETWVSFMRRYGGRYRVIAPDQRGHGLSGKPLCKYTPQEMVPDMIALLDYLQIKSAIVVGHSMGGLNAGYMAAEYPEIVRAVAILDKSANGPAVPNPTPPSDLPLSTPVTDGWSLPFKTLEEVRENLRITMEGSDLACEYFMESLVETPDGYGFMFSLQAMAANIAYYENWYHRLPRIKCPSLLVRSSSHEGVPDEDWLKMQSLLPDGTAFEVSHPDHNVYLSREEEFYAGFDAFLSKIERAEKSPSKPIQER